MPEADGVYLGKFTLNGYTFKAYERETVDGSRQFRLSAFPSITREQEAALIRYLVNEGLVEHLVQGLSKRIEEERSLWIDSDYQMDLPVLKRCPKWQVSIPSLRSCA